ncbi:MAG: hypothetical protein LBV72_18200 [Tannerella sp.]|jgi:hypothetical protein|nr:hypothetical protein [Tannerella sp.]
MELEKLKEIWTSLDNRMQQQEVLKTTLIKEILISKSDKALSRLINYSYFGIIICLIAMPILIWIYSRYGVFADSPMKIIVLIVAIFTLFGIITGIIQILKLHKIDFANPVKGNIYMVENLNIYNKRTLIYSYVFVLLLFLALGCVVLLSHINFEPWRWVAFITGFFTFIFGAAWEYKRIYRRNFNSILKSLEELKELEETE